MEMIFEKQLRIYENINFCSRYENLSKKNQFENTFENYSNDEVVRIIEKIGHRAKFIKNGNFFKIEEKAFGIKFYFHINLKYGFTELIIGATNIELDEFILGGPFGGIFKDIAYVKDGEEKSVRKPKFSTYEELQEILKEALSIYEDFKVEFLKQNAKDI